MAIPEETKLVLRQESGFGCCKCGIPIIVYHHIVPRSIEDHNRPEDMMALWVSCHDMCKGAMTEVEQRACKAKPFNIERGNVDGQLKVNQEYCTIALGTCTFFGESIPFSIDGVPLLAISVKNGRMYLSLTVYDKNDRLLAEIDSNDWISGDPAVWDLWCSYQKLKIRTKLGDVRLDLDASSFPMQLNARLMKHGKEISIKPSGIRSPHPGGGLQMDNTAMVNVGFNFNTSTDQISITGGILTREFDQRKRLEWGIAQMAKRRGSA